MKIPLKPRKGDAFPVLINLAIVSDREGKVTVSGIMMRDINNQHIGRNRKEKVEEALLEKRRAFNPSLRMV